MNRFINKNVIVTGGTSGIGAAAAKAFAAEGANVIITGRNADRGNLVVSEICNSGTGKAVFYKCDLCNIEDINIFYTWVSERYDAINVLFNNAGVFLTQSLDELDIEQWNLSFNTNVTGTVFMTKVFINMLAESKGNIVNNASISGMDSFTSGSRNYLYGTTKAALVKLSKLCALNYAPKVRVNVIAPGIIDTDIYTNKDYSRFDGCIPMGYIAKPEQVAKLVLFLASEDADYITGAVIPIDGGMSLK